MNALLRVEHLTMRFGGLTAVNDFGFTANRGDITALIGPNGAGKTTVFNCITGFYKPSEGRIALLHGAPQAWDDLEALTRRDARSVRRPDGALFLLERMPDYLVAQRARVARTFQNIRLFSNLPVLDNILIGEHSRLRTGLFGTILRLPSARIEEIEARQRAIDIAALFGNRLIPRLRQIVSGLSYANRRRVEIARALATRPKLLLLDEPTAGMNPAETLELAEQIKSLHGLGLTVLIIEHKLDVVTQLADTVVVLDHGEKLTEGKPAEVRRNEDVLRAYLGRAATEAAHAA